MIEEGVTIAKVLDWMVLKPEMMRHLIKEHERVGRTLTEEETVILLRGLGFEISEAK
jgi:transketolase C-terminal domain/subunit